MSRWSVLAAMGGEGEAIRQSIPETARRGGRDTKGTRGRKRCPAWEKRAVDFRGGAKEAYDGEVAPKKKPR